MVNEFHGREGLQFNINSNGAIAITGDTWLVNFDVPADKNSHIVEDGVGALLVIAVACFAASVVVLGHRHK